MSILNGHTTRAVGTVLTAEIYNSDHLNHVSNASTLNTDKMEGTPPPVVDGHAVVWDGVAGNSLRTTGFFPANKAGETFTGPILISGTDPSFSFYETDAPADSKGWRLECGTGTLYFSAINDVDSALEVWLQVERTGYNVTAINFASAGAADLLRGGNVIWDDDNFDTRVAAVSGGGTVNYLRADGIFAAPPSQILTRAYGEYTANANLTVAIPFDDTIPQNTEGTEILNVSITPSSATNRVRATFTGFVGGQDSSQLAIAALFRDSIASALIATVTQLGDERSEWNGSENVPYFRAAARQITFTFEHSPGTTSATSYKVRVGGASTAAIRMNGLVAGRCFGGVAKATLTLQELPA